MTENSWLNPRLKAKVRKTFEPRYKRKLTDEEVIEIANNLSNLVEHTLKFKWRQYAKKKAGIG